MNVITQSNILEFENELYINEKSMATVKKYISAVHGLSEFLSGRELTKPRLLEYRGVLQATRCVRTVNGALSAINAYLSFCGLESCKVKLLKIQRQVFLDESRELTTAQYKRLLNAALDCENDRLYLLMLTLCSTGIRISELRYITVEAAKRGKAEISLKGKIRTIILQKELRHKLLDFSKQTGDKSGCIFHTRSGNPLDRSNICHDMKKLCKRAKVDPRRVFPHNFRHLFARTFYSVERNLSHLADVLGHSRIETTRIYVAASASAHERILNKMKLVV